MAKQKHHQFQLYVYRPGFKNIGQIHTYPTLDALNKNKLILEQRGFITEPLRKGKRFDHNESKNRKEVHEKEKREKHLDAIMGMNVSNVSNQISIKPSIPTWTTT